MMLTNATVRAAAIFLGSILVAEGSALPEARAQALPATAPAPTGAPLTSSGASLGSGEILLAAAPTAASTTKRRTSRKRSTRKRRRPAPLRLPAVTPYGIPRLNVKAAY